MENEEGILIQVKGNHCLKLKKGKLKTKKLLKITAIIRKIFETNSSFHVK